MTASIEPPARRTVCVARLRNLLLAGASGTALMCGAAGAQTPPAAPSAPEEIIVTARRHAEPASRVPYNITAITGKSIEARNLVTPNELLRTVPGVSVVDRGPRNAGVLDGARIRGVNVDSAALGDYAVSSVSPLSSYINETPVFADLLLKDLNRVEVLRGPQATLYGSGSLGGTVRYIQNEPDLSGFSGKVTSTQSYTENSDGANWNGDLTLNVPLTSTLAFRGTLSRIDDDGYIDYTNLYKLGADGLQPLLNGTTKPVPGDFTRDDSANTQRTWFGHAAMLWEPNSDLKIVANYSYQNDHVGGRQAYSSGTDGFGDAYNRYDNGAVIKEPSSREVNLASLEATYDLGFATLTSSTSYYDHRGESITDNTGFYGHLASYYYPSQGFLYYFSVFAPNRLPLTEFVNSYSERAWVQETRLASTPAPDKLIDYVVGIFYEDQDRGANSANYAPGLLQTWETQPGYFPGLVVGDRTFFYKRDDSYQDRAGFGEITLHATSRLSITGGMRYFSNESDVNALIGGAALSYNNIYNPNHTRVSENRPLGKGNLSYRLDDNNLVYATVSQGYRRGGSNAIPVSGPQRENEGYLNYNSDSVVNYEVGVKGRLYGIVYSLAAFYIDWTNVQVNIATPGFGYYAVVNGPSAVSKGFEAELHGHLIDDLGWSLGYAYTNASLTADIVKPPAWYAPTEPYIAGSKGALLPGVPANTINLALDYTVPLSNGMSLVNRLGTYYQSTSRNQVSPGVQNVGIDPFSIWTLSSTLDWHAYEATLFVKNLFNAKGSTGIYTQGYSGSNIAANFYGNDSRNQITTPLTAGLTLSYKF
jgi:outer membrane receptor protein involved in Fe transport